MTRHQRKRLLIDGKVQGALVVRVIAYWVACVITVELLTVTWRIAVGPEQPTFWDYFLQQDLWGIAGRLVVCGLLLVPISMDFLRLSNRFAGPVYRMQCMLKQVAAGGEFQPVRLRENDFWQDFANDLNAALARQAPPSGPASQAPATHEKSAVPVSPCVPPLAAWSEPGHAPSV